jgi:fructuronate reductase
VVTLTVSEKAYHHDPATDGLRVDSPDVAADLADGGTRTVVAQLVHGLDRRRRCDGGPLTVVCCDNLPDNGRVLARLVSDFAGRRETPAGAADTTALQAWIEDSVRFPSTMVDRIVPATTAADRAEIAAALGVEDRGPVVTEPFRQWVIQDDFAGRRPAWERAGATLTADVAPYERIKLRMLNGSHSTLACLGVLAGHDYVHDCLASGPLPGLARALMDDDVAPTLDVPAGVDLTAYRDQVLERFANPALPYRTLQVAMDGSQKLPGRLLDTVRARRRVGAEPAVAALGVAAWMRYVAVRRDDRGRPLAVDDPLADAIAERVGGRLEPAQIADALLPMSAIFGDELGADAVFRALVIDHLHRLERDGAQRTAQRMLT